MTVEQTADDKQVESFRHQFFDETGIVLRQRTRSTVRGTIGFGHDRGEHIENILEALRSTNDLDLSAVLKWGNRGIERFLIGLNSGEAFIYSGDAEEDIASIVGDIHTVRYIGKVINDKTNPNRAVTKDIRFRSSPSFDWVQGRTPYDSFSPNELWTGLNHLAAKNNIVSNPSLSEFHSRSLIFSLLANVENRCYVIAGIDSVNIIGWIGNVRDVVTALRPTFQKPRALVNMTSEEEIPYF